MRMLDRFGFLLNTHDEGLSLPTLALALLRGVAADRKMQYRDLLSRSAIDLTFVFGLSRPCAKDSTWVSVEGFLLYKSDQKTNTTRLRSENKDVYAAFIFLGLCTSMSP
jgi:hypothetical protein